MSSMQHAWLSFVNPPAAAAYYRYKSEKSRGEVLGTSGGSIEVKVNDYHGSNPIRITVSMVRSDGSDHFHQMRIGSTNSSEVEVDQQTMQARFKNLRVVKARASDVCKILSQRESQMSSALLDESALANLEKRARKLLKQEPHGCLKFTAYDVIVGVYRKLAEKTSDVVHDTSKEKRKASEAKRKTNPQILPPTAQDNHKQQVVYDPKQKHQIIPIVTQRGEQIGPMSPQQLQHTYNSRKTQKSGKESKPEFVCGYNLDTLVDFLKQGLHDLLEASWCYAYPITENLSSLPVKQSSNELSVRNESRSVTPVQNIILFYKSISEKVDSLMELRGCDNEIAAILPGECCFVYLSSLATLSPKKWLDGSMMDYLLNMFAQGLPVCVLDSYACTSLLRGSPLSKYYFDRMNNSGGIMGAYNKNENHWNLLFIHVETGQVLLLDPYGSCFEDCDEACQKITEAFNVDYASNRLRETDWKPLVLKHSKQEPTDICNCGIFTSKFAQLLLTAFPDLPSNLYFPSSSEDLSSLRRHYAENVLSESVAYEDMRDETCSRSFGHRSTQEEIQQYAEEISVSDKHQAKPRHLHTTESVDSPKPKKKKYSVDDPCLPNSAFDASISGKSRDAMYRELGGKEALASEGHSGWNRKDLQLFPDLNTPASSFSVPVEGTSPVSDEIDALENPDEVFQLNRDVSNEVSSLNQSEADREGLNTPPLEVVFAADA